MGEVHAFASHSWSDDGNLKYDRLHEWAGGDEEKLLWLDKACIDQSDIAKSLACLPVFLSGCQELLILAGPTYASRLWCVMEIFTFVQMGGAREDMPIKPLDDDDYIYSELARFDAAKADCFLANDRQKLLAVIEASFGTFHPFNSQVRSLFKDSLSPPSAASRAMPVVAIEVAEVSSSADHV